MTTDAHLPDSEREQITHAYRRLWKVGFAVALVSLIPLVIYKDRYPWIIAVPILCGVALVVLLELRDHFGTTPSAIVHDSVPASERMPLLQQIEGISARQEALIQALTQSGFIETRETVLGLLGYANGIGLEIVPRSENPDQMEMAFLAGDRTKKRKERIETLATGEQMIVVSCDRFVDLLISGLLPDADRIVETAILAASRRYSNISNEEALRSGVLTKAIMESLKAEFRGNWITAVSRHGERVIQKLEQNVSVTLEEPKVRASKAPRSRAAGA